MPYVYSIQNKQVPLENLTTNGTANTESEQTFVKPGAARPVAILALIVQGKAAGATQLSGLMFRLKQWTTTAGSGGTSVTPGPTDPRGPAAAATAGITTTAAGTVTTGTGGPTLVKACGCSVSGPGGWTAINPDAGLTIDGGANKSTDLFSSSGTISLNYEVEETLQEM
jgi:hypothetical protein